MSSKRKIFKAASRADVGTSLRSGNMEALHFALASATTNKPGKKTRHAKPDMSVAQRLHLFQHCADTLTTHILTQLAHNDPWSASPILETLIKHPDVMARMEPSVVTATLQLLPTVKPPAFPERRHIEVQVFKIACAIVDLSRIFRAAFTQGFNDLPEDVREKKKNHPIR